LKRKTYTLTSSVFADNAQIVIRDADGASIPPDPRNGGFQVLARRRQYADAGADTERCIRSHKPRPMPQSQPA
jgi:hypothetical protein